jgi:hypothetical protein
MRFDGFPVRRSRQVFARLSIAKRFSLLLLLVFLIERV